MKYTKEQKELMLKEIAKLRLMDFTWKQVEEYLKKQYGIKWLDPLRKEFETLNRNMLIENKYDTHDVIDLQAKLYNKVMVEQKKTAIMKNEIHKENRTEAFRQRIIDILSDFKLKTYPNYSKVNKVSKKCLKTLNKAVYIIADEHFKGKCDIIHLNRIYDDIESDIKANKYQNVELWYLGDGIDGLIHTGSLSSNDGTIIPAIDYINILIERANQIPQVKSVKFIAQSNHTQTRPLGTSRNELAREDINYMLIEILKRGLRKDIELVADDILRFNYEGFNIAMLHGHQPFATNKNKLIEYWSAKYHEVPDIILMGHFHQFKISEYGLNKWLVVCPTAKNFNGDYEQVNGFISYSQITKMTIKDNIPVFQIMGIRKD